MEIAFCNACGARTSIVHHVKGEQVYCAQCTLSHTCATVSVDAIAERPARDVTRFYFCERCGKRITEDRHDKKLKGVYCKNCAGKVMTIEFAAIKEVPAKVETLPPPKAVASKAGITPATRKSITPSARHPARPNTAVLIAVVATIFGSLGLGTLLFSSGNQSPSTKAHESTHDPMDPVRVSDGGSPVTTMVAGSSRSKSAPPVFVRAAAEIKTNDAAPRKNTDTTPAEAEAKESLSQAKLETKPVVAPQSVDSDNVQPPATVETAGKDPESLVVDDITPEKKTVAAKSQAVLVVPPAAPPPIITSSLTASGTVGVPFTYKINATNNPTAFEARNLPVGLTVNTSTGIISGTPATPGIVSLSLTAANAAGKGAAALTMTVRIPNSLEENQIMTVGTMLVSLNGRYVLTYQVDGNIVLCDSSSGATLWHTSTTGRKTANFIMQNDGNLVLYDIHFKPLWTSGTYGKGKTRLVLEDSGKIVIYAVPENRALWSSKK